MAIQISTTSRRERVAGALIGSVVGDALGAPFEFGPAGRFSARFPEPARGVSTEMCGGGPWAPGEWTDGTQMALLVALSLLHRGGVDEADLLDRFRRWAAAVAAGHRGAGNGSLMRTTPAALFLADAGREATMAAARRISAVTHGDPAAGEGCAIFHELVRVALDGDDLLQAVPAALEAVAPEHRARWAAVLDPAWTPADATESNGAVWPTLGSAVWALRHASSFEEALRSVVDLGGDTDTVAAVTGGLVGAVVGITGIPMRWASAVHGALPGHDNPVTAPGDLHWLAGQLAGFDTPRYEPEQWLGIDPLEVIPGVWAADLAGARRSAPDFAVVSLCRTGDRFPHAIHRLAYLVDDESNADIARVLDDVLDDIAALRADGRRVLVHCFAGASRTGLVLRALLCREEGLSPDEATDQVQRRWPHLSLWNPSFDRALVDLAARRDS